MDKSDKKVKIRVKINRRTLWHMQAWARALGYPADRLGWVVDKLVREKALALKDGGRL